MTLAARVPQVLLENQRVRVLDVWIGPGETVPMHSHPDHVVYSFTESKLQFRKPDGTVNDVEFAVGETAWLEAQSHEVVNVGRTECHVLVTEIL